MSFKYGLPIERISHTSVYQEDWHRMKLGKFSASKNGDLIGKSSDKGTFTDTAITLIENLAGEIDTGKRSQDEIFNDDINWGNAYEPEAIQWFRENVKPFLGKENGEIQPVLKNEHTGDTHRLILYDEYSCCTPDALVADSYDIDKLFDPTGERIRVAPLETKCPKKFHRFVKLRKCKTPEDLKKEESKYHWQVITQMLFTDAVEGFFCCYHPFFEVKGSIIHYRRINLTEDFNKLIATLTYAKAELIKTVTLLKN